MTLTPGVKRADADELRRFNMGDTTTDTGTAASGDNADTAASGDNGKTFEPIASQEALDKIVGARVARERKNFADYDALKAKAEKFDAAQEAAKSEQQKLIDRVTAAEDRATKAESAALRAEVARTKGVPASSLNGATREELEASADELLDWRGESAPSKQPRRPAGPLKSGATGTETGTTAKDRAAAALREMRQGL
ncbi:hypothetical protein ACFWQG_13080 [Rhodococcus sp. NPDC058532]|uniref:hypothetical protein n=1 Tax=Rhodococcus sp. NPDC058532 TaxID=3346540 RepID=UPI0036463415